MLDVDRELYPPIPVLRESGADVGNTGNLRQIACERLEYGVFRNAAHAKP
jgi:hypothetical protein